MLRGCSSPRCRGHRWTCWSCTDGRSPSSTDGCGRSPTTAGTRRRLRELGRPRPRQPPGERAALGPPPARRRDPRGGRRPLRRRPARRRPVGAWAESSTAARDGLHRPRRDQRHGPHLDGRAADRGVPAADDARPGHPRLGPRARDRRRPRPRRRPRRASSTPPGSRAGTCSPPAACSPLPSRSTTTPTCRRSCSPCWAGTPPDANPERSPEGRAGSLAPAAGRTSGARSPADPRR
jgi:hypothetical protein